jgi:hypothetical protein
MMRWFTDLMCTAEVCRSTSDFLSHIHATGWFFIAILAVTKFQQIKEATLRTKDAVEFLLKSGRQPQNSKAKSE